MCQVLRSPLNCRPLSQGPLKQFKEPRNSTRAWFSRHRQWRVLASVGNHERIRRLLQDHRGQFIEPMSVRVQGKVSLQIVVRLDYHFMAITGIVDCTCSLGFLYLTPMLRPGIKLVSAQLHLLEGPWFRTLYWLSCSSCGIEGALISKLCQQ